MLAPWQLPGERLRVTVANRAEKDLTTLPQRDQTAVEQKLNQLRADPFSTDIRKLEN